jgi:hypothetical protein
LLSITNTEARREKDIVGKIGQMAQMMFDVSPLTGPQQRYFIQKNYCTCILLVKCSKWLQIKKLSNTKFHNFLRYTTFILRVYPFEVANKFKFYIWDHQNLNTKFFVDNIIDIQKLLRTMFHNLSRYTTIIYNVSLFDIISKIQIFEFEKFICTFRLRK